MKFRPSGAATFARSAGEISTAPAFVLSTWDKYLWFDRNARCAGPALSSGARPLTRYAASPAISPPKRWVRSPSVIATAPPAGRGVPEVADVPEALDLLDDPVDATDAIRCGPRSVRTTGSTGATGTASPIRQTRLVRGQRLQHLVCNVYSRTHVHRFLHDQVVMLLLRNLLDHLVRAIQHPREFLVASLVQVLAKLALLALEVLVELRQVALLGRAV